MDDNELGPVSTEADSSEPQTELQDESQEEAQTEVQDESQSEGEDSQSTMVETNATDADTATDTAAGATVDATTSDTAAVDAAPTKPKRSHKGLIIAIVIVLVVLGIGGTVCALFFNQGDISGNTEDQPPVSSATPNQITDFDLAFLENKEVNQLYSPLSIKYALGMLEAGAAGDSRQQIKAAVGSFAPQKYPNNKNMSFANALFINNNLPDTTIKSSYTKIINERFGAEILRVPFDSATSINNWVSDKTFGLVKDLVTDEMLKPVGGPEQYFALVNALAIDMEWVNKIQPYDKEYYVGFPNINYSSAVEPFVSIGFHRLSFNDSAIDVNSLDLAATIHKYDILSELGVDNIRQTIIDEYTEWLNTETGCVEGWPEPEVYVEEYLEELGDGGYKTVSSSTDFSLYDDDEVKVFAKDLRTYDGVTLQYVGIMPKTVSLKEYIQNLTTDKLASTISQIKPIVFENFKDGVVTEIVAKIPVFKFEDKLDLMSTLEGMGITGIFSETRANLSNLANDAEGLYIGEAVHKTTVDFSNDGIKASAATVLLGGMGANGCGFRYYFDVPVEKIDLTFDNPYLFLIRDKDSGVIWFVGTVYEPTIYTPLGY